MKFLKRALLSSRSWSAVSRWHGSWRSPPPLPAGSAGAALMAQPPWSVGMRNSTWSTAAGRPTPTAIFPAHPNARCTRARGIRWSARSAAGMPARAFPLIVYSHGFFSTSAEARLSRAVPRQPRLRGRRGRFPAHHHEGAGRGERIRRGQPARRRELPDRHAAGVERRSRERLSPTHRRRAHRHRRHFARRHDDRARGLPSAPARPARESGRIDRRSAAIVRPRVLRATPRCRS